jgi:metal-dependent HD superfamily phosphatase/phosphodiesterase
MRDAGLHADLPDTCEALERDALTTIETFLADKPKARHLWQILADDAEVSAAWDMADYIAVSKLGHNDHGETHAKVAAASALSMLSLVIERGMQPEVIATGIGDADDAALIVLAAALLHDIGNQIHRIGHEEGSVWLALPMLDRLLPSVYPDMAKRTRIRAFILSAIYTHDGTPVPLTIEAAIVCVGDATDMTKGRGRLSFDLGSITIHTVSALSIESVMIARGKEQPIAIIVRMSNSAGIYQVQEILAPKVQNGPLAGSIDIIATIDPDLGEYERRILYGIRMQGRTFVPDTAGETSDTTTDTHVIPSR